MLKGLAFFLAASAAATTGACAQQVGGRYTVSGTNFDGSPYKGTAVIEATSNSTCRIHWNTGSTSDGICMRRGDTLAAGYVFNGGKVGLVIYQIRPDGTLEGSWTVADTAGSGTETLTPR